MQLVKRASSPGRRAIAREPLEYRREMRLALKADLQRNLDHRSIQSHQQGLGALDAPMQKIRVRAHARSGAELGSKVHARQAGRASNVFQPNRAAEILFDISRCQSQAPQRQRRERGSSWAAIIGSSGANGSHGFMRQVCLHD